MAFIKEDDEKFVAVHTVNQDGVPAGQCQVNVMWAGDIGTTPPKEYEPMLQKYGFGTAGLIQVFTKNNKNGKLDFPE